MYRERNPRPPWFAPTSRLLEPISPPAPATPPDNRPKDPREPRSLRWFRDCAPADRPPLPPSATAEDISRAPAPRPRLPDASWSRRYATRRPPREYSSDPSSGQDPPGDPA